MNLSLSLFLYAAGILDFRIAESHDKPRVMVLGDAQHLPGSGSQLIQHLGAVTHDGGPKSMRIAQQFEVGRSDMAVGLAVFRPFSNALLMGDEQVRSSAEQQIVFPQTLFRKLSASILPP